MQETETKRMKGERNVQNKFISKDRITKTSKIKLKISLTPKDRERTNLDFFAVGCFFPQPSSLSFSIHCTTLQTVSSAL